MTALDFAAMTWTEERPEAKISVAHRPLRGMEDQFPGTRVNVRYCNDRPACAAIAHEEGPWTW